MNKSNQHPTNIFKSKEKIGYLMTTNDQNKTVTKNNSSKIYQKFGKYYDVLYDNYIDYQADCDFIEQLFKKYHKKPEDQENNEITILDIGCGTGSHALELGHRDYNVFGLDVSEDSIKRAQFKLNSKPQLKSKVQYAIQDLQDIAFNKKFDGIMALFGVLSYLPERSDIAEVLINIRQHLKPHGLFMGEIWQFSGIIPGFKNVSSGKAPEENIELIRFAESRLTDLPHTVEIKMEFTLKDLRNGDQLDSFTEYHYLHAYDLDHFEKELNSAGLQLLGFYSADKKLKDFSAVKYDTLRTFFVSKHV